MERITTATKSVDLYGAGKHGFKDGNLGLGISPTDFNAAWCNQVQEELANAIEAASIALNGADRTQLLQAINVLVKRGSGNDANVVNLTGATTLTSAHVGNTILFNGTSYTATLPDAAALSNGSRITAIATVSGTLTLARQGSNSISTSAGGTLTSIGLGLGDTLVLEVYNSNWYVVGGSAQARTAKDFSSSLFGSGYQKLPSGLIIQWGAASNVSSGGTVTVSLPIAFPTAALQGFVSILGAPSGSSYSGGVQSVTLSQITIGQWASAGGIASFVWLALGY